MLETVEKIGIVIEFLLGFAAALVNLYCLLLLRRSKVMPSSAKIILFTISISIVIVAAYEIIKSAATLISLKLKNDAAINDKVCATIESIFYAMPSTSILLLFALLVYERTKSSKLCDDSRQENSNSNSSTTSWHTIEIGKVLQYF